MAAEQERQEAVTLPPRTVRALLTAAYASFAYALFVWASGLLALSSAAEQDAHLGQVSSLLPQITYQQAGLWLLFVHEAWVLFQHGNVLCNPCCQHLDRDYGIRMLRGGEHWAIAATLAMYWLRELASMLLCLPFVASSTQTAILVSSAYHSFKMDSVCADAMRKWSPPLGVMRILIDHWHFETIQQKLTSALRVALQGGDTAVHGLIVCNLVFGGGLGRASLVVGWLHSLFAVWLVHAMLNQVTQKSTATFVVESWRYSLGFTKQEAHEKLPEHPGSFGHFGGDDHCAVCVLLQRPAAHHCSDRGKVPPAKPSSGVEAWHKGLLAGVATLRFAAIVHAFLLYITGSLARGSGDHELLPFRSWSNLLFLHEAWVFYQHANVLANPFCQRLDRQYGISMLSKGQHWTIAGTLVMYWSREVLSLLVCMPLVSSYTQLAVLVSVGYHCIKMYNICVDAGRRWSVGYSIMSLLIDHWHLETPAHRLRSGVRVLLQGGDTLVHLLILRDFLGASDVAVAATCLSCLHPLFVCWALHAALNQATRRSTATLVVELWRGLLLGGRGASLAQCSVAKVAEELRPDDGRPTCKVCRLLDPHGGNGAVRRVPSAGDELRGSTLPPGNWAEVVFLAHPAYPSDVLAWWAEGALIAPAWCRAWWSAAARLAIALRFTVGAFAFGAEVSLMEDTRYAGRHVQTWCMHACGFNYLVRGLQGRAAANVVEAATWAEAAGARVLCLGALNKAEWINRGGLGILPALKGSRMRVVHGNTLTAAVVVESTMAILREASHEPRRAFLTGATSKVGAAVCLRLLQLGVDVVACSESRQRLEQLAAKAAVLEAEEGQGEGGRHRGVLTTTTALLDGMAQRLWIVGKSDPKVGAYMPLGALAVTFAVPDPLELAAKTSGPGGPGRIRGGILRLDTSRLTGPRQHTNMLGQDEIYACHAAGIVAGSRPASTGHELGDVLVHDMEPQWLAAQQLGFSLLPEVVEGARRWAKSRPHRLHEEATAAAAPGGAASREGERTTSVIVIGAGPSGLATAAALRQRGVEQVVLFERHEAVQGGWRDHHEDLTITTRKAVCGLPGWPVPKSFPDELAVEDYVRYLQCYAAKWDLQVLCGMEVGGIRREAQGWKVRVRDRSTGVEQEWCSDELVITTGKDAAPSLPSVGQALRSQRHERADGGGPMVVHSAELRGAVLEAAVAAAQPGGSGLLLLGLGNSAVDIISLVARSSGPEWRLHVALRRVPPVVRRQWGMLRMEWFARWFSRLCDKNGDRAVDAMMRLVEPDLKSLFPAELPRWTARRERRIPTVDRDGSLLRHIREGHVVLHRAARGPALEAGDGVVTAGFDGEAGSQAFGVVIFCTGYEKDALTRQWMSDPGVRAFAHMVGFEEEDKDLSPILHIGRQAQRAAQTMADLLRLRATRAAAGPGAKAKDE